VEADSFVGMKIPPTESWDLGDSCRGSLRASHATLQSRPTISPYRTRRYRMLLKNEPRGSRRPFAAAAAAAAADDDGDISIARSILCSDDTRVPAAVPPLLLLVGG